MQRGGAAAEVVCWQSSHRNGFMLARRVTAKGGGNGLEEKVLQMNFQSFLYNLL